jgi:ParB family transcriptional regulator, chromosome partitioning protein
MTPTSPAVSRAWILCRSGLDRTGRPDDWAAADINRPLKSGDRLWSDADSRAELSTGSAVVRMARNLAKRESRAREAQFGAQFEAAELLTLGLTYEKNPRFAGGAYSAFLKKVDRFIERPLATSLLERAGFASRLQEIDTQVRRIIAALQTRGFKSPYLRNYVVARINPVRFHKAKKGDTQPAMPIAAALTRMAASAKKFNVESVSGADLAWVAVGAGAQE